MCVVDVEAEKLTRRHMGGKIKQENRTNVTQTLTHTQKGAVLSFCLSPKKKGIEMKKKNKNNNFLVFCVKKKQHVGGGFPSRKLIEIKRKEKRTFFTVINVQHVPVFFF